MVKSCDISLETFFGIVVMLTSGTHPGEGFWGSKPLPFGSKSTVSYGWHFQAPMTWWHSLRSKSILTIKY